MRNSLFKGHEPRGFTRIFLPVHKHPTFLFLPAVLELRYYIYHHFFLLLRNYTSFFFFSFAFRAQNPFSMYRCLMSYHNKEAISSPFQRLSAHQMLEPGITRATKVITSWPEPQLFLKYFWRIKREARDLDNIRARWDPHSKPGLFNFLLKLTNMIYRQLPRFLSTFKQTRLETQDLFVVNCHRKYHFTGAHKSAESLRLVPIFAVCKHSHY